TGQLCAVLLGRQVCEQPPPLSSGLDGGVSTVAGVVRPDLTVATGSQQGPLGCTSWACWGFRMETCVYTWVMAGSGGPSSSWTKHTSARLDIEMPPRRTLKSPTRIPLLGERCQYPLTPERHDRCTP